MSVVTRIGVDVTGWDNPRGYGRFTRNIVTRMVQREDAHYTLLADGRAPRLGPLPSGPSVRTIFLPPRAGPAPVGGASRPWAEVARLSWRASRERFDAFLFPSVGTYFPVLGAPTVVGVHDTIADELPDLALGGWRARAAWRVKQSLAVRRATRLFTVSEASRRALASRVSVSAGELAVIPEAPDPVFAPRERTAVQQALERCGVERPYVLYAGGLSPHKNLPTLIRAYALLARTRPDAYRLVLAGDLDGGPYLSATKSVRGEISRAGIEREVVLPGFVSDGDLACLYSGAAAVALPSLAEGFGLPAVEAAACGAATVVSDLAAHRETLGDAALYFAPTDCGALARALERVLADDQLRGELSQRGQAAAGRLSWELAAARLSALLLAVARSER